LRTLRTERSAHAFADFSLNFFSKSFTCVWGAAATLRQYLYLCISKQVRLYWLFDKSLVWRSARRIVVRSLMRQLAKYKY
jgi:hypothetical protein